jgi:hypothetical protein
VQVELRQQLAHLLGALGKQREVPSKGVEIGKRR